MTDDDTAGQTVLVGNDGGFGLPEARTYERDDGTEGEIPPDEVFLAPLRTHANGWKKYHAERDCGAETVRYVEDESAVRTTERYDWKLYCFRCERPVRWDEILYVSQEWYEDRRQQKEAWDWRLFDSLHLQPEAVLELGPDPMESELLAAIGEAWERYQDNVDALREHWDDLGGEAGG